MNNFDQNFVNDLLSNQPLAIYCSGALIVFYLLNFAISDCASKLGLVVANTLITNTYVWNLVTSCFFETNAVKLVLNVVTVVLATRSLKIGSFEQFGLYMLFAILASTTGTSVYCFFKFYTTGTEAFLVKPIYGFNGVIMALMMYCRQQLSNELIHPAIPRLTYNNFPVILLLQQILLYLIGFRSMAADLPFSIITFLFSWSYLRFFYRFNENELPGDKSEEFSFVAMFPEALHIILIPFTTAFYNIFALIGLFPVLEPTERKTYHHLRQSSDPNLVIATNNNNINNGASSTTTEPTKQDLIAERRKAKAMKLLDAKMAELSQEQTQGWEESGSPIDLETASRPIELVKLKI